MAKDPSAKKIYGLIGYPVRHSFSPAMHNAAFTRLNINAEYKLFEIKPEQLKGFLLENIEIQDTKGETFFSQDITGFNITIPHKVRASEILLPAGAGLDKNITIRQNHYVFLSGAINTVKRESGRILYYNTDAAGFMKSLEEDLEFDTKDKNVFIFGCGGAGRAIIAGLTLKDSKIKKIYVSDINKDTLNAAEQHFKKFDFVKDKLEFISTEKQIADKTKASDLLINASPIGMKEGDASVIDKNLLHEKLSVYDVVYNRETQLIRDAKSQGLTCTDGRGMLLYQGAEAFGLWTGKPAPIDVMRQALEKELEICRK